MQNKKYKLIIAVMNRGFAEEAMDAAREAGAIGGTILNGRGINLSVPTLFGMPIEPEKSILLTAVETQIAKPVLEGIFKKSGLGTPANGICFALPIEDIVGLDEIAAELTEEQNKNSNKPA